MSREVRRASTPRNLRSLESIPLILEERPKTAFPELKRLDKDNEKEDGLVDRLLCQASLILDAGSQKRDKRVEQSLKIQRGRAERRRQYEISKENPPIPEYVKSAQAHKGERPLKTIDEWLGNAGPKVRSSTRELDRQSSVDSYIACVQENHSQFDSEVRANSMARNSEKLRRVNEQLRSWTEKTKSVESSKKYTTSALYQADEVLAMLTTKDLQSLHSAFGLMNGRLNFTEFVEVMQAHLPKTAWRDHALFVHNICDLYAQLDVNGDGSVSWDEMFEFTIEMGRQVSGASEATQSTGKSILPYFPARVVDSRGTAATRSDMKDSHIESLCCLGPADKIAILEKDSSIIKLYDAESLALTDCLPGHKGPVRRCLLLEDTDYVVTSGADGCLIFWGAYTNNQRQLLPCDEVFSSLAWDVARRTLYAGSTNGTIRRFHVPDVRSIDMDILIQEEERFAAHTDVVTDMLVIRDLGLLITASLDTQIHIWDLSTHAGHDSHGRRRIILSTSSLRMTLRGHTKGVSSLTYIPPQRYLISAGYDRTCMVWNPMLEVPLFNMLSESNLLAGLQYVNGSDRVVTCDVDGVVKIWDIRNFNCVQTIKLERVVPGSVAGITYVQRLDRVVIAAVNYSSRKVHKLICLDYSHPAQPEFAEEGPVVCALYSRIHSTITTASSRTIRVWDAVTGLCTKIFPDVTTAHITAVCFDGHERKFIIGDESGGIGAYNYLNCTFMKSFDSNASNICALAYCSLSHCLLAASWGGKVCIYHDINSDDPIKVLRQIDGHSSDITCMVYSVTLGLIATASSAGGVRVWDLDDAKFIGACQAHVVEVTLTAFLEEYRLLLTGDFFGNLILWTTPPWRERCKPVCCFEYVVDAADGKRDTPTCCAFDPHLHLLFIGGSSGFIVAYDVAKMLESLLDWQGVDGSGTKPGSNIPMYKQRQSRRAGPREGKTHVPEIQPFFDLEGTLFKGSSDLKFDVTSLLEFGIDSMTGQKMRPHMPKGIIEKKYSWQAHSDAVKTIQYILPEHGKQGILSSLEDEDESEPSSPQKDGVFLTHLDGEKSFQFRRGALLTASHDQRVMLWGKDGTDLGHLRQGDTKAAEHWEFPVTRDMVNRSRKIESERLLLKVM